MTCTPEYMKKHIDAGIRRTQAGMRRPSPVLDGGRPTPRDNDRRPELLARLEHLDVGDCLATSRHLLAATDITVCGSSKIITLTPVTVMAKRRLRRPWPWRCLF